jgi:1,4-alpha-glucan branching enzyme
MIGRMWERRLRFSEPVRLAHNSHTKWSPSASGNNIHVHGLFEKHSAAIERLHLPGQCRDVVVVVSLREQTFENRGYDLGFPLPGEWYEVFNSDVYDFFPNPWTQGNGGAISADGPALHGLPYSAGITIPANSVLVFARDKGD